MVQLPNNMNVTPSARPSVSGPSIGSRIGSAVGQVFGGGNDPILTPEQNQKAQAEAMVRAGLAMLGMSGSGAGWGQVLASGAMTGQEVGAGLRQQTYLSTQEERLRQALQNPRILAKLTPEQQDLIALLPPMEAGKMLMELAFAKPAAPLVVAKDSAVIGADGQEIYRNQGAPEGPSLPVDLEAILWATGADPSQLTPEQRTAALSRYEELKRAGATNVNVGGDAQQRFTNTNSLATQFRQEIADALVVANGYAAVKVAANNPSPAADLSLVFAYMKMLDPNSTVREGEAASAANAGSVPERIRAQYNRALSGETFTAGQRADFLNQARLKAETVRQQIQPSLKRFRSRAEDGGIDPNDIIYDPFEGILGDQNDDLDGYF